MPSVRVKADSRGDTEMVCKQGMQRTGKEANDSLPERIEECRTYFSLQAKDYGIRPERKAR